MNVFQNITFITNESMRLLKNNLQFIRHCDTGYESKFMETPKKGETIQVRKPARYVARRGELYTAQAHIERTVNLQVQETSGVDVDFTNRELMFNLERFAERVLAPVMMTLANDIDRAALEIATPAIWNAIGTPGTIPTALKTYNSARARTVEEGAPQDEDHALLITPDMQVEATDAGKSFFHPTQEIREGFLRGVLGRHAGARVYECQNLVTQTVGAQGGTPLTNGAAQTGSSLVTDGWTASITGLLKKGDRITIAAVRAVNPWTRKRYERLRQFVVTADVSSDGSGNATIPISPAIVTSGPFQNVDLAAADNAAITVSGAASVNTPQAIRFHRDAFLFGSFKQPSPEGAVQAVRSVTDPDTGITIRFIRDWDTEKNKEMNRFDVVWAFGVAYEELACVIYS